MPYTPENNPYIPGDPYSYDLKWLVQATKGNITNIDSFINRMDAAENNIDKLNIIKNYLEEALKMGHIAYVTPELFGAVGDGVTDDTKAIQEAIDSGYPVVFSNKVYAVSANASNFVALEAHDNTVIYGNGGTLKLKPNPFERYRIVRIRNAKNVFIDGLNIKGDLLEHAGTTGEHGYGVFVEGSVNVTIINSEICECWGDSINVAAIYEMPPARISRNVTLGNLKLHDNRRQGISIEGCNTLNAENIEIYNIAGTAPQAGIDIEPSVYVTENGTYKYEYFKNIHLNNITIHDTIGRSIMIEDAYSSEGNSITMSNITAVDIAFTSRQTDTPYGTKLSLTNAVLYPSISALLFNTPNTNSDAAYSNIYVKEGIRGALEFNGIVGGTININGLTAEGDHNLIEMYAGWTPENAKGLTITGLSLKGLHKIPSIMNEAKAGSAAVVKLSSDVTLRDALVSGQVLATIANRFVVTSATSPVFVSMPWMFDEFEIEIVNLSSTNVALAHVANGPNVYYTTLSTAQNVRIQPNSKATAKFSHALKAWVITSTNGTVDVI